MTLYQEEHSKRCLSDELAKTTVGHLECRCWWLLCFVCFIEARSVFKIRGITAKIDQNKAQRLPRNIL